MKGIKKSDYIKIQLTANWVEAGDSDKITRRFDSKEECDKYTNLWGEFLQDIKVEEVFWDKKDEEWKPAKIEGEFIITRHDTILIGNTPYETPFLELQDKNGFRFFWVGDKTVEIMYYAKDGRHRVGDNIKIKAFCRPGQMGAHLYRVKIA